MHALRYSALGALDGSSIVFPDYALISVHKLGGHDHNGSFECDMAHRLEAYRSVEMQVLGWTSGNNAQLCVQKEMEFLRPGCGQSNPCGGRAD